MEKRNMRIEEVASILGTETYTLKYYQKELQLPVIRNSQGFSVYNQQDVLKFKDILSMREDGLQLGEVKNKLEELDTAKSEKQKTAEVGLNLEVAFVRNATQKALDLINSERYNRTVAGQEFLADLLNTTEDNALELIEKLREIQQLEKTTKEILDKKEKEEKIEMVAMLICKKNENRTITLEVIKDKYICTEEEALSVYRRVIQLETIWETLNAVVCKTIQEHPEIPLQTIAEQTNRSLESVNSIYAKLQDNIDITSSYATNNLIVPWEKAEE